MARCWLVAWLVGWLVGWRGESIEPLQVPIRLLVTVTELRRSRSSKTHAFWCSLRASADEDKKKLKECGQDWFWGKPPPSGGEMVQDVARLWGKRAMEGKKEGEEEDTKISMSF